MLKKYIALLFLCISNLIIIGHDIIPHEHFGHTEDVELTLHHESGHGHDHHHTVPSSDHDSDEHEDEHSSLGDLFAHFIHTGSYFPESENQFVQGKVLKDAPTIASLVMPITIRKEDDSFSINQQNNCWHDKPIYISPHSLSSGLRAPPVSIS